jgi:hypothetical protein
MIFEKHHIQSSTEIVTTELIFSQSYKQQCIEEAYRLGDSMNQSSNVKALRSTWYLWDETQIFNLLLEKIIKTINISFPNDDRLKLRDVWSVIYKKEHYSIPHAHHPSYLSFVYYLKSNGNTPLVFDKCNFQIHPTDNTLVIFPSYLVHSVPTHKENQDRICIAGNLDLINNGITNK